MAVIKCKMCGGDLNLVEGASTAECEYCGSVQTVPKVDDEKKLTLFARANRLRAACEFDKAAGIYETIVADFPEEAEAYWGLVLCKFGIEYVDDPGTAKKIPTCHRSSFECVMEDGDLDQALENADAVARKVYRDEAKQIEEIRKGIIAVSANEEPYDIFICYKETDENGERTLDSVMAQDVYDALTDKGYRVFFARITLEDKLGMEYEPYIFAALNSAKIMLVFGTDYEYFNAVWVKNEWGRYLKLMAKDKEKHLIPCYKGIDAYDMPKEFAKLQAQDLGKVGATQDLLRGITKILPKQIEAPQYATTTRQSAATEDPILRRGYLALEDAEWTKADEFFEEVLNHDPENAHAYIGKALAAEKCATLDELSRKRLALTEAAEKEEVLTTLNKDNSGKAVEDIERHANEIAHRYAVAGYLPASWIVSQYTKGHYFLSEYNSRKKQLEAELAFWCDNRFFSRAVQFSDEGKKMVETAREKVMSIMRRRVEEAQTSDQERNKNIVDLQAIDEVVIAESKKANELRKEKQEGQYKVACDIMNNAFGEAQVRRAKGMFVQLADYKDSAERVKKCRELEQKFIKNAQRKKELEAEDAALRRERNTLRFYELRREYEINKRLDEIAAELEYL